MKALYAVGFTSVGVAKNYIHVDDRKQEACWYYERDTDATVEKLRKTEAKVKSLLMEIGELKDKIREEDVY